MSETKTQPIETKNILQSFLVKTNIEINLNNLVNTLPNYIPSPSPSPSPEPRPIRTLRGSSCVNVDGCQSTYRSGTIIALKYKNIIKGNDQLFKTKTGFKNACHLIICYTLNNKKRVKKMIHVKITAVTFQVVGIPAVDVEKIIYKIFLLLEKINKSVPVFTYVAPKCTPKKNNRLEILIVPILNNYMLTLPPETTQRIFHNSKVQIVQKFIHNGFISFMVPNDPAITIKTVFVYKDFSKFPIQYIIWNKKRGQTIQYIEYDSYTTLLKDTQKSNAQRDKYLTLRLYSSGKVLASGFHEKLITKGLEHFLAICNQPD
jgi:hypothetical protein